MYDPLDFSHGIDQLAQAEALGDAAHRASILELMLSDLDTVGGNLAEDLTNYVAELSLFPDDAVDMERMRELHGDLAASWASFAQYGYHQEQEQERARRSVNARPGADANKIPAERRREAIEAWVDRHFAQKGNTGPVPSASTLASWLITQSRAKHPGFVWPDGVDPVGKPTIQRVISKHLKKV